MTEDIDGVQDVYVQKEAFDKGGGELLSSVSDFITQLINRVPIDVSEVSDTANMSVLVEVFRYHGIHDGIDHFFRMLFPFEPVMGITRRGLEAMEATEFLMVFDQAYSIGKSISSDNFDRFKRGQMELDDSTKALFKDLQEQLKTLEAKQSLVDINAQWLAMHPRLRVLEQPEWDEKLNELAKAISLMQERSGEFSKNQTRSEKIALALSKMSGKTFQSITSIEPRLQIEGQNIIGHNFTTKQGSYFFYERNGEAVMHEQVTMKPICRLPLGNRFPTT